MCAVAAAYTPASPCEWLDFNDLLEILHGGHAADLAIAYRDSSGWCEKICTPPDAAAVIDLLLSREHESFVGQAGYHGQRRVLRNIKAIPALFCDLDYGDTPKYRRATSIHPVYAGVRDALPSLPEPTLLASSSQNGGYAVWVLNEPLHVDRLPDWQPVQDSLCKLLKPFGADNRARDATRVLRVPGSRHPSGEKVRYWQVGGTYSFEALEKAVKALIPEPKVEVADHKGKPKKAGVRHQLNGYSLAYGRMRDLRSIAASRAPMADYRKRMLFIFSVCASWFCPTTEVLTREVETFAADYFKDAQRYPAKSIGTTRRRFEAAKAGLKIPWNSPRGMVEIDPRYRLRNETIIEWLGLDDSEMQGCRVIIPPHLRLERRAAAEERRRRLRGARERAAYLDEAQRRRQLALELVEQGKTTTEVAGELGCSKRLVQQILKAKRT